MIVALLAAVGYGSRLLADPHPAQDALFRWSTPIGAVIGDAVILAAVLLIARGLGLRTVFALRRPRSWGDALRVAAAALAATYITSGVLEQIVPHAAREQALTAFWDPARVPAYAASVVAIGVFAPIVEEALCRGLGFHLLLPWGTSVAVVGSALAFAFAHGAVLDLPWVLVTGLGLGILRARSGSLYPSVLLHVTVNSVALVAAAYLGATAG